MLWHSCVYFFQWTMRWKILASSYGNLRLCTNAFKWVMAFWFPLDPYVPSLYVMFVVVTFSISVCVILKKGFILFLYAFFHGDGRWREMNGKKKGKYWEKQKWRQGTPSPPTIHTHTRTHTRIHTHKHAHIHHKNTYQCRQEMKAEFV